MQNKKKNEATEGQKVRKGIFVNEEELNFLRVAEQKKNTLYLNLGMIEVEIQRIVDQKNQLLGMVHQMNVENKGYLDIIEKKYGKGNVNLDTGEYLKGEQA